MRRSLQPSALPALLLVSLLGCRGPAAGPEAPKSIYLWRVSNGPEVHGWVLGSVHFAVKDAMLDAALTRAFDAADALAVELDVDDIPVRELMAAFSEHGRFADGYRLPDYIGDEDFARARRLLGDRGLVLANLDQLKPWVINLVLITSTPSSAAGGGEIGIGVDRFLVASARGNKPILSLETLQEQVRAFSSADDALQAEALRRTLTALEQGHNPLLSMVESYFDGTVEETLAEESAAAQEDAAFAAAARAYERRLIQERNAQMAKRIDALLRGGQHPFVVVGAAHLVGEENIPQLLAARGYDVQPVAPTGELVTMAPPEDSDARLPPEHVAGYDMQWPAPPEKRVLPVEGNELEVEVAVVQPVTYMLSRSTLPPAMVLSLDKVYEQALILVESKLGGPVAERASVTVSGIPANRYRIQTDQLDLFGLHVWADGTLYDVAAVVPRTLSTPETDSRVSAVLDSFVLHTYTDETAAAHRTVAMKLLGSKPAWLFPHADCPTEAAGKAAIQTGGMENRCDIDVHGCVERCTADDPLACMHAGDILTKHSEPAEFAAALHARACVLGLSEGCTSQAGSMFLDDERQQEWPCALETFRLTCAAGEPWGCALHAMALARGRGLPADTAAARSLAERACSLRARGKPCQMARQLLRQLDASGQGALVTP